MDDGIDRQFSKLLNENPRHVISIAIGGEGGLYLDPSVNYIFPGYSEFVKPSKTSTYNH